MTTTDTIEAPGPLGEMTSRTRAVATAAHMEPVSALEQVIAGHSLYAPDEEATEDGVAEPPTDQDTPTRVLPPESLADKLDRVVQAEGARELHVAELDRATALTARQSEHRDAEIAHRMIDLEAYALAMAAFIGFPLFGVWRAERAAQARSLTPAADVIEGEQS